MGGGPNGVARAIFVSELVRIGENEFEVGGVSGETAESCRWIFNAMKKPPLGRGCQN